MTEIHTDSHTPDAHEVVDDSAASEREEGALEDNDDHKNKKGWGCPHNREAGHDNGPAPDREVENLLCWGGGFTFIGAIWMG